ncbi:MAG: malonic semialdehyde reductase [Propionicimonas sp.]
MTLTQTPLNQAAGIFTDAHTAYRFTDEPVSDEQLQAIYHLTKFAPTAMNSQPLRITFVRSDEAKQRLLPLLNPGNRAKSASAPVIAILAADTDFHDHLPRIAPQNQGAREHLAGNDDARARMAANNAWLQAGAFILAVRATGLDAGPMGGFDADGVDAEFFPGTGLRSFLVVNLGVGATDGFFPRNPRLEFDEAAAIV